MKLGDGVEQAIHVAAFLAGMPEGAVMSAAALAEYHGVSASYLLKHLQSLSGAGILDTVPGPQGGYRLGRAPARITLLDVVLAVEGAEPAFRCKEIRRRGPGAETISARLLAAPCQINAAMLRAERAWRAELAAVSIADIAAETARTDDGTIAARGCAFIARHGRGLPSGKDGT
jgi:Rrf2 family protein